jgi:hypothetical protein
MPVRLMPAIVVLMISMIVIVRMVPVPLRWRLLQYAQVLFLSVIVHSIH